jgi:hypothetical protein
MKFGRYASPTAARAGPQSWIVIPARIAHGVIYRLGTKTVEMPGMGGMDVKTIGPDNKLRLVVTAA